MPTPAAWRSRRRMMPPPPCNPGRKQGGGGDAADPRLQLQLQSNQPPPAPPRWRLQQGPRKGLHPSHALPGLVQKPPRLRPETRSATPYSCRRTATRVGRRGRRCCPRASLGPAPEGAWNPAVASDDASPTVASFLVERRKQSVRSCCMGAGRPGGSVELGTAPTQRSLRGSPADCPTLALEAEPAHEAWPECDPASAGVVL